MQRTSATRLRGAGWSRRAQAAAIRAGMSPGGRNDGSSGSMTGPPGGSSPAASEQGRQVLGRALELPRPERLLEQPQTHHVAQVADPVVDAALVREVGRATLLGQDRAGRARRRPATTSRRRCTRTGRRRPARRRRPTRCRASRRASAASRREPGLAGGRRRAADRSTSPGRAERGEQRRGDRRATRPARRPRSGDGRRAAPVVEALVTSATRTPDSQ